MEKFQDRIKKRIILWIIITVVSLAIVLISYVSFNISEITGRTESFMRGFQAGLFASGVFIAVLHIYTYAKAIKSEAELRKLYIKETDERNKAISNKITCSSFMTTLGALLVASIVAGYYSVTVFVTLLAVLLFMCVIAIIYKCIYYKIM